MDASAGLPPRTTNSPLGLVISPGIAQHAFAPIKAGRQRLRRRRAVSRRRTGFRQLAN